MTWYQKLPLPGSKSARARSSAARKTTGLRLRTTVRAMKPERAFYKAYSSALHINGYKVKVTSRYQIAKLFGVSVATVTKWEKAGALPTPIMYQDRGKTSYPIYLSAQVRCLVIVINDLVKDGGYISIPWASLGSHLEMLHKGYDHALYAFQKRAGYFDDDKEDEGDKFGVTLLD